MERNVNIIFIIIFHFYSSNNDFKKLNKHFVEFFREYFINVEFDPDKNITIRFYISLLQTYIENIKCFERYLINAWDNEIKPFILQKFPITKEGLFNVNSDLKFVIDLIDSLKEKFGITESDLDNKNYTLNLDNKTVGKIEKTKDINKDIKKEVEILHKSVKFKRKGTEKLLNDNNIQSNNINDKEKDIKILRKENISKINMFLLEFINNNILEPKRTNSMINLRPHSQTIDSKTTCDSSIKEDNSNIILNINNLILNKNQDMQNINNDSNKKEKLNSEVKENDFSEKKKNKQIYGKIFIEEENHNSENKEKIKSHLRSKSITLVREMNPFYKEDVESEGYSISYKNPQKTLNFIYPDILLKKIIFEDFLKKNVLLIHHFCQQCFCFVNKEIFFRKIFHCYNYYKKKLSIKKLKNMIDFINILVLEMFIYYQKINLKDVYVILIKKFYNELITDLIIYLENSEIENDDDAQKNYKQFSFENIDYYKNEDTKKRLSNNYKINRENLINLNLNIEIKNIKIFIFKDKENQNENNDEKNKKIENDLSNSPLINKSLTFRQSLPNFNSKSSFLLNKISNKDFKEDQKEKQAKNNDNSMKVINNNIKSILPKEDNKILSKIIEEEKEEIKDEDIFLKVKENNNEKKKEKEDDNQNEQKDLIENKEKKQKLYMISKTLRKSQIVTLKKTLKDSIIEEEEQKEKSENEQKNDSMYSDKSSSKKNSSSENSSSENGTDKNEEKRPMKKDIKISKEKEEEEYEKKLEIINNILEEKNISLENIINTNEQILKEIKFILILFENDTEGEPSYQDIKEAKDNIYYYKSLENILNKQKKKTILPRQRQKRLTKSYSFFNLGTISNKIKESRDYLRKGYFCVVDWKTEEIGDQLMQASKTILNKIYPRELYRAIFLKKDKEITSPNVVECINKNNRLTSFIIEDILSYDFPKERARIYEKWISIAEYCKINKDYNDLLAIFSALNHYIITGLKLTLKEVRSRFNNIFRQINEFCTMEGNYRKIREDMNNCEKTEEIFIPFLGMMMKDINYFEESSKYINENGCINFEKIERINQIFNTYFKFKTIPEKKNKIKELMFFDDLEDISEEKLDEMANNLEPEFKMREIPKSGKRLTNIDKKYFEEYKYQYISSFTGNIKDNFPRRTISVLK